MSQWVHLQWKWIVRQASVCCTKTYSITVFTLMLKLKPKNKYSAADSASLLFRLNCFCNVSLVFVSFCVLLALQGWTSFLNPHPYVSFLFVSFLPSYGCTIIITVSVEKLAQLKRHRHHRGSGSSSSRAQCSMCGMTFTFQKTDEMDHGTFKISDNSLISPHPLSPSPLCALVLDTLSLPLIASTYQSYIYI